MTDVRRSTDDWDPREHSTLVVGNSRIKVKHHVKGISESYSSQTGRASVVYDVPWADRWDFCTLMLGYSQVSTASDGTRYVSRVPPQPYTGAERYQFTGDTDKKKYWLWATSVESIEGQSPRGLDLNGFPEFDFARIKINFETLSYRVYSDQEMISIGDTRSGIAQNIPDEGKRLSRFVTRFAQPASEYLQLPFGRYKWAGGPKSGQYVTGAQLGLIIPTQEVVFIWHQVPRTASQYGPPAYSVPRLAREALGTINHADFPASVGTSGLVTYPKGTLLLTSIETKPYKWIGGQYYVDITYKMKYLNAVDPRTNQTYSPARGHNHFLQMTSSGDGVTHNDYAYHLVSHDGTDTGLKVYRERNFNDLFRPNQGADE